MYEDEIINHQTTQKDPERLYDKLYLWLNHLQLIWVEKTIFCYICVMIEQPESGYKDTALEIAGKGIIKLGYCMLLKSRYTVLYFSSSSI